MSIGRRMVHSEKKEGTHIKVGCCHTRVDTSDDLLRDTVTRHNQEPNTTEILLT